VWPGNSDFAGTRVRHGVSFVEKSRPEFSGSRVICFASAQIEIKLCGPVEQSSRIFPNGPLFCLDRGNVITLCDVLARRAG